MLIASYTGLLCKHSKLSEKHIPKRNNGNLWILLEREKTKTPSNIPILPQAHNLIKKYVDHPGKKTEYHIFLSFSNQKLNAYLKELADLASIDKNLTFHTTRHTFATTITLANGVPIESISSMLGHKNIRTTQIYSKVVNEKITKPKLFARKLQIYGS
ncbi:site-specific integrase [Labilibaculum sp. K2S]|uniref:site-specific integrase n=1 Tax=Labilibaculum sp. K2S TaxID=3056386 RepID=UPI0025A42F0B|nr:site-specific integrase [Labilibaculum sp. K2S]MDM8161480.1 site-specific integrase [Labilibaculum sp. K2S]